MYCEKIKFYERRDDVFLQTYVWEDSMDLLRGKPRPAVLICPGGAYLSVSDGEGEPIALAFANMGYHAFVLHYSVYTKGNREEDLFTVFKDDVKEHCMFPRPMQDIGAAMLYIRAHSEEWHVDMDQVAVCGFSAGGHNCAMYSVYWDKPEVAGFFGVDPELLRPAACILGYALTDYVYMHSIVGTPRDEIAEMMFKQSDQAFFGTTDPDDEQLRKVSPALLVDANTPPMYLWATSEDSLVPVQHSILMARSLADAGIPFELHIFEKGMHGLGTATEGGAGSKMTVNGEAAKWVPMCHAWLKKRFKLELDEKPFWMEKNGI